MNYLRINKYWILVVILLNNPAYSESDISNQKLKENCPNPNEVAVNIYPDNDIIDNKNKIAMEMLASS